MSCPSQYTTGRGGPLAGITVLDLSAYLAGPYGCTLLADLGARVIKIEPPGGDNVRHYPSTLKPEARGFVGNNRSKEGIVLDLKHPDGLAALKRLIRQSDVLVHNFRPGVPARLGISYACLSTDHPRLVYCAVTGYGESGPLKDHAGYDQVLQTMTGLSEAQGAVRNEPPQLLMGSIVDYYTACMAAFGIVSALYAREHTGCGQYVGASLMRSALAMQAGRFVWADSEPLDAGREFGSGGVTGLHPTRDGWLYISANTPHFWKSLCRLLGLPALGDDDRYDSIRKRAERAGEIVPAIREALLARSALEWEAVFGSEVPCAAARSVSAMFSHPQVLAQDLVHRYEHPTVGSFLGFKNPIEFGATPCPAPFASPTLGQHTRTVLASFGFEPAEIEALERQGTTSMHQPAQASA